VATDCLSEGINLQDHFDAVFHYDLSWNPTRHEQREGRVDRYGQPKHKVRVLTYYGIDNQIDGIVLDVLLRKHKAIRNSLGISVPVPVDTNSVVEAVFEGLLLREDQGRQVSEYVQTSLFDDLLQPAAREELFTKWDEAATREKRSRTLFAQESIKVDQVMQELQAVRAAIGSADEVEWFVREGFRVCGATITGSMPVKFDVSEIPSGLKEIVETDQRFIAQFQFPVSDGVLYLNRTHPVVEGLGSYILTTALDPLFPSAPARRSGVIRSSRIERRTTLLLLRFRFHIVTRIGDLEQPLLAEDCQCLAYEGSPRNARWLEDTVSEELLRLEPEANVLPEQARDLVGRINDEFELLLTAGSAMRPAALVLATESNPNCPRMC
jgi:hypothetical protein